MATEAPLQSSGQSGTTLRAGAIGLGGATMQAVATIAPAIAGLFFTQYVVSLTGVTAPLAYVLGVCIVLMLGSTLVQLSKHMSSAGGYYTFVSRAINPRVGFLTAWMYVFYNPLCAGPIYAYFGYILQQELKAQYGINAPYLWWLCLITGAPFVAFLAWRGLALSVRVLVGLGLLEMSIVFALALSGFISPGPGGDNVSSWIPSHSLSGAGFALAVVFSLQGLTGWEAAAPLAEETTNPRRNIPRATMIAILALGAFLVIVYWGQIIGWGTSILTGSSPKGLVKPPDPPGARAGSWCSPPCSVPRSRSARRATTCPPGSGTRWARPARCRPGSARSTRSTGPRRTRSWRTWCSRWPSGSSSARC